MELHVWCITKPPIYVFDVFQIYVSMLNKFKFKLPLSLPSSTSLSNFTFLIICTFFHKWINSCYCLCIFECPCNLSYCSPGQILTLINCWVIMNVSGTVFSWPSVVLEAFSFNGRLLKGDLAFIPILLLFQLQRVDVKGNYPTQVLVPSSWSVQLGSEAQVTCLPPWQLHVMPLL